MKDYNKLIQNRVDKNFNIILVIIAVGCLIGSILLFIADLPVFYGLLNLLTGIIMLGFYALANRISTSVKISAIIVVTVIVAIASFIGGEFRSSFLTLLFLVNIFAVLFLTRKESIIVSVGSLILMFALAYYSIKVIRMADVLSPYIVWGLQLITFVLYLLVLHISVYSMKNYLIENIEGLEKAIDKTNQLAYYDRLTRLPNAYMFEQEVKKQINRNRQDGFILFFSLKSLDLINSTLGHEVGNQTLIESADLFTELVGEKAIISRIGGNKFALWIENITEEDCIALFTEVLYKLKDKSKVLRKKLEFHSVLAKFTYDVDSYERCYQKAILTLTHVKNNNISGLLAYNNELEIKFRRKELIKDLLESAITNHEIEIYYQIKYNTQTNHVVGVEGLARWTSEKIGRVAPNEFIPIIESMNLSSVFGIYVIGQVCRDYEKLVAKYDENICVSLNISPSHIIDPCIVRSMKNAMKEYNIPSNCITIEITEEIIIKGINEVKPILKELREIGVKISLDDFGTGYSSLNYISQLELDEIKIDKSFVDQIEESDRIHILIENIIHLSKQLNLMVVAEGVETQAQSDVLKSLDCFVIQGYYYGKPEKL